MRDLQKLLEERDIEIFELEQRIQELQKYKALYFRKYYEIMKYEKLLIDYFDELPDSMKYHIKGINERNGVKFH